MFYLFLLLFPLTYCLWLIIRDTAISIWQMEKPVRRVRKPRRTGHWLNQPRNRGRFAKEIQTRELRPIKIKNMDGSVSWITR